MGIRCIFGLPQEVDCPIQVLRCAYQVSLQGEHLPQVELPDPVVWLDGNCVFECGFGGSGFTKLVVSLTESVLGFCRTRALLHRSLQLGKGRLPITLLHQETAK